MTDQTDTDALVSALGNATLRFAHESGDEATVRRNRVIAEARAHLTTQAAQIAALTEMLAGIKWKSADRDNMEFSATITYSQMDRIRAALKGSDQ